MGLEEGRHFTVKIEGSGKGYVYILREGLERAAWLSIHASEDQRKLAAEFVNIYSRGPRRRAKMCARKLRRWWRRARREAP